MLTASKQEQRTVKAFDVDIVWINEQSKARGCTAAEFIHELCEMAKKAIYLQDLGDSFDAIVADPKQFAAFQAENDAWDDTLSDGADAT